MDTERDWDAFFEPVLSRLLSEEGTGEGRLISRRAGIVVPLAKWTAAMQR